MGCSNFSEIAPLRPALERLFFRPKQSADKSLGLAHRRADRRTTPNFERLKAGCAKLRLQFRSSGSDAIGREFGAVIALVTAAGLLGFLEPPGNEVRLNALGLRFHATHREERRTLFAVQLQKLALFIHILELLEASDPVAETRALKKLSHHLLTITGAFASRRGRLPDRGHLVSTLEV